MIRWPLRDRKGLGGGWGPRWSGGLRGGATEAEPPAGYEAQVREAFGRNAIAQRAVRLVAESAGSAPVTTAEGGHPALSLLDPMLLETVATHLLLHGNSWIETGLDLSGRPVALWTLRPERVRPDLDADGWPQAWLYRVGARDIRYPAEGDAQRPGLLHLKTVNPLDDHLGAGCLGAAIEPVAMLNAAARWNRSLISNAARPSGAIVHEGKAGVPLSAEQFDRLRDEIEAGFQGAANAGRPMLLDGGLRWQPLALTPAEMDFGRAREAAAREVALAFGVPPMLLGLPGDATYANYAEANVALWRLTVLPLVTRILARLSAHFARWWPGTRLEVDLDRVPALWGDRERLWRHVSDASFLTVDEKREMLGWGPMEPAA
ncbi:MAG: phage portal protein [Thermaurantiacus sp.]